jgi:hypothetical protein
MYPEELMHFPICPIGGAQEIVESQAHYALVKE